MTPGDLVEAAEESRARQRRLQEQWRRDRDEWELADSFFNDEQIEDWKRRWHRANSKEAKE